MFGQQYGLSKEEEEEKKSHASEESVGDKINKERRRWESCSQTCEMKTVLQPTVWAPFAGDSR